MCVCEHVYVFVHIFARAWRGLRFMSGIVFTLSSSVFFEVSKSNPEMTNRASLLSQLALEIPFPPSKTRITSERHAKSTQHLHRFWGLELCSSGLCGKHFKSRVTFPETRVTDDCELLRVCWESKRSLVEEQPVLLDTEPSLQARQWHSNSLDEYPI